MDIVVVQDPSIKHSPRLTEFELDCIGFSTIPNASVNFPVVPVSTTRFTPRRRTTILVFVTSVSKTPLPWQIYSMRSKFVIPGRGHVTWSCVMRN